MTLSKYFASIMTLIAFVHETYVARCLNVVLNVDIRVSDYLICFYKFC